MATLDAKRSQVGLDDTAYAIIGVTAAGVPKWVQTLADGSVVVSLTGGTVTSTPAASELHLGQVGGHTNVASVTFSLDTSAYASGDLIADTQAISSAFRITNGTGVVQTIVLNDKDDQGVAMTVYFLDSLASMGTENAAPSITDTDADRILGWVDIATTDWKDLGGCKVATIRNIGLPVKAISGAATLGIALVNSTGTPTFTASGITGRIGILQD